MLGRSHRARKPARVPSIWVPAYQLSRDHAPSKMAAVARKTGSQDFVKAVAAGQDTGRSDFKIDSELLVVVSEHIAVTQ